ncbi:potassium voltage-gated channel protein egl-36-like isoform X3 [Ostrea edulis]|uniref:potassium voltage-gated channel protein egl-36-like isoform X3 n=1 Tax=Ostrea edulis TaxID=37623 RepID=UPI0024AFA0E3|nr:potassium voltage-gated channel protein egl-36-like isoform X3 [Ostrea edulis]
MGGDPDLQRFNIRGTLIITSSAKFQTFPDTKLGKLTNTSPEYNPQHDEYFIDRNPMIFHLILDFYNTGDLHLPKTLCAGSIRKELEFWEIHENLLRPCCWKTLYSDDDDCEAYTMIRKVDCTVNPKPDLDTEQMNIWNRERKIRHGIWDILNKPASSIIGKIWFTLVFLSVTVSIVVFGLSTTTILRSSILHSQNTTNMDGETKLYTTTTLHNGMIWTDFATNLILEQEVRIVKDVLFRQVGILLRFYSKIQNPRLRVRRQNPRLRLHRRVLLKRGTENGMKDGTENGKYFMQ